MFELRLKQVDLTKAKSVILVSGFDSIILLENLKRQGINPTPVYFKFGVPSEENEIANLPEGTQIHDIPDEFKFYDKDFSDGKIPDLYGRTTIMHVLAARRYEPDVIFSGVLADDPYRESEYYAKSTLTTTLTVMLGKQCAVSWPWQELEVTKRDLVYMAVEYGLDLKKLVSCYQPEPCGSCPKCNIRTMAEIDFASDIDLAKLLTTGELSNEQVEEIYQFFGTDDPAEIFQRVGL